MRSVQEVSDPKMLEQVAVLLERENATLHAKLHALAEELARLRGGTLPTAQHELASLKELLAQRERARFGPSSEQRPRREETGPVAAPAPPRGHGPTAQPRLPIVEKVHELDTADRTCPQCGGTLQEMTGQTEDSEEITVVERQFALLKHQRNKYRCACNGCVDTAPGPPGLAAWPDVRGHRTRDLSAHRHARRPRESRHRHPPSGTPDELTCAARWLTRLPSCGERRGVTLELHDPADKRASQLSYSLIIWRFLTKGT